MHYVSIYAKYVLCFNLCYYAKSSIIMKKFGSVVVDNLLRGVLDVVGWIEDPRLRMSLENVASSSRWIDLLILNVKVIENVRPICADK